MFTLYTTYLSKLKSVPDGTPAAVIMRSAPMSVNKYDNVFIEKDLSPSIGLLLRYKKDNDFEAFKQDFIKELNVEPGLTKMAQLEYTLENENDVVIVCCEKDRNVCHRSIIGDLLEKQGINVIEL